MNKREALLKSALKLFVAKGFYNTPTSLITKEANVATGTLFHHFSSKEELINALYLECKKSMMEAVTVNFSSSQTIKEKIRLVWENMLNWTQENSDEFLFLQQIQNDTLISQSTLREAESLFAPLTNLLNEAIQDHVIKDLPLDLLGEVGGSIINATFNFFLKHKEKINESVYKENAFLLFLDALKK